MKNLQATLFMVLMAISTSTMASAAQKQLSEEPAPVTSTQGNYPLPVIIIETICPLPFGWPLV